MATYNNLALPANRPRRTTPRRSTSAKKVTQSGGRHPAVAEILQPTTYPIGTKRICLDIDYFETFNRDNVTLVDISKAPIQEITEKGLITGAKEYEFDAIVFATGFDAMTGSFAKIDMRGPNGQTLKQKWSEGPKTYLGLMVTNFPNMFFITGPGSPSVLSNMIVSIEQHVDWITECPGLSSAPARRRSAWNQTQPAEDAWVAPGDEVAFKPLYPQANSWYMGANIPGKPRVFMPYIGGVGVYRQKCNEVAANGYEGFALSGAQRASTAAE